MRRNAVTLSSSGIDFDGPLVAGPRGRLAKISPINQLSPISTQKQSGHGQLSTPPHPSRPRQMMISDCPQVTSCDGRGDVIHFDLFVLIRPILS
jgi:hypothetical protein